MSGISNSPYGTFRADVEECRSMEHSAIIRPLNRQSNKDPEDKLILQLAERDGIVERVQARTVELALLAGRASHQIRQGDYEQAKREIPYDSYQYRL